MACFFGSTEDKDKVETLQAEILSLKLEIVKLRDSEADLASNSDSSELQYEKPKDEDSTALDSLKQELEEKTATIEELHNDIAELTAENATLKASQRLLKQKNKTKDEEIVKLKVNVTNNDDEKQPQPSVTPRSKQKGKKYNLNKLDDQIEVLHSQGAKARSVLLCIRSETITTADKTRNFGFAQFLETSMGDKVVDQLFSKFKSETVDGKQLSSLLTLAVIIYKVKLHKMKTGSSSKPEMDSSSIKGSVEHLAAWIIRNYGEQTDAMKRVSVQDDMGKVIKGEYSIYSAKFHKKTFKNDATVWVNKYVETDGSFD